MRKPSEKKTILFRVALCHSPPTSHLPPPTCYLLPSTSHLSPVTWTYTFSAKEKDTETGLSYFGSRYYSSDLSIWLSVDPMASKYPHQSNYVYCSNNPIKVIDPNGEDEWEVNKKGNITWKCESEKHQLFAIDKKGKRTGEYKTLKNKNILTQLTKGKKTVLSGFDGNVCEEGNSPHIMIDTTFETTYYKSINDEFMFCILLDAKDSINTMFINNYPLESLDFCYNSYLNNPCFYDGRIFLRSYEIVHKQDVGDTLLLLEQPLTTWVCNPPEVFF